MEKFKTRAAIELQIAKRQKQIKKLENEMVELRRAERMFSDRNAWWAEQEDEIVLWGRPKLVAKVKLGGQTYKEKYHDQDTGKAFCVERFIACTIDGCWNRKMRLAELREKAIEQYYKERPNASDKLFINALLPKHLGKQ